MGCGVVDPRWVIIYVSITGQGTRFILALNQFLRSARARAMLAAYHKFVKCVFEISNKITISKQIRSLDAKQKSPRDKIKARTIAKAFHDVSSSARNMHTCSVAKTSSKLAQITACPAPCRAAPFVCTNLQKQLTKRNKCEALTTLRLSEVCGARVRVDERVDLANARQRVHDDHLLLGLGHHVAVDDVEVLERLVLVRVCEPLLLHARHVQHVRLRQHFVQLQIQIAKLAKIAQS